MKKQTIALALILGTPLAAQTFEVGVFVGQQQYPSPHAEVAPGTTLRMEADNKTVYAARFGFSVVDLGPALLQLTAGFQPEVKSTTKASLGGSPYIGTFKENHWSAGAMLNFKALVALGAGLEFRSERLSGDLDGASDSTTYNRVWVRLNAGYAIPTPVVKPFFGVEAAFPLSNKSLEVTSTNSDALKSLAPKSQIGVYAGIRF
jgi:hypothetical protein